jgi:hypothetical protein
LRVGLISLFTTLAALSGKAEAQGGPPLVTDDPGTPGPGHWELNAALTVEHDDRESIYEVPLVDLNYGVGDRLQLKVELPVRLVASTGSPTLPVSATRYSE